MKEKRTLLDIATKIQWEGGLGEAFSYFGREVKSEDTDFNAAWRVAWDAYTTVEDLLPEIDGEDDE